MVCHGEHTYLFAQAMMSILAQEEQGGSAVRRIGQEVQKSAHERYSHLSLSRNLLVQDGLFPVVSQNITDQEDTVNCAKS